MVRGFSQDAFMRRKRQTRLIHEGAYVAEVQVDLIFMEEGWSPYLSIEDASKLDNVREALRKGDLNEAGRYGHVFELTPIAL
jgi:hypothetical protein